MAFGQRRRSSITAFPSWWKGLTSSSVSLSAGEAFARREPGIQHEIVAAGNEAIVEHAAEVREPEPIPTDGWVAQTMKDVRHRQFCAALCPGKPGQVAIEAIDAGREDVVHNLGTALGVLESRSATWSSSSMRPRSQRSPRHNRQRKSPAFCHAELLKDQQVKEIGI